VNILCCNQTVSRMLLVGTVVAILGSFFPAVFVSAQDQVSKPDAGQETEKIHIIADLLTSDREARFAEFSGNVRATQGDTVITSDQLKIFYAESAANTRKTAAAESQIKRIVATGNVKILFDKKVAVTEQAVYNTETKVLVLSGPDSKITSGADSITGAKITYYRSDGHMEVESGQNKRVEAVFHSKGSGIR